MWHRYRIYPHRALDPTSPPEYVPQCSDGMRACLQGVEFNTSGLLMACGHACRLEEAVHPERIQGQRFRGSGFLGSGCGGGMRACLQS